MPPDRTIARSGIELLVTADPLSRQSDRRALQTRALVLAFVAMFASAPGQSFLIAVFVDELLQGTGLSRTSFSVLYAFATILSAISMVFLGRAADRFGLRAAWALVSLGLAAACVLAGIAAGALVAFLALALLRTFGQGSFPLVGTLLAARWFGRRRGQAIATATFGITAAASVLPPLVVFAIVAVGWRQAFLLLSLLLLSLVFPLALLVREPGDAGGGQSDEPSYDDAFPPALRRARRLPRVELPTRRSARLLLVLSAPPLVITAIVFHAVSLLAERGLGLHAAGAAITAMGVGSALGTLGAGAVADRVTTRLLLSLMSGLLTAAVVSLLLPGGRMAFASFALLGVAGGVFGVASGIVWARTYGLAQLGRLQGTSFAVQIGGAALGPLPLAVSGALTGSYVPALLAIGGYALLALVAALRWRDPSRLRRAARVS